MLNPRDTKLLLELLLRGLPPPPRLAEQCLVGLDGLLSEWKRDLQGYISQGGSLLRVVAAPSGGGKTHLGAALKAVAAQSGFLVCQVDAQAQQVHGDDLQLYRAFCMGLRLPPQYLEGADEQAGLLGVLSDVAERMDGAIVRKLLRSTGMPIPALKDALVAGVDAIRQGRCEGRNGDGWRHMISAIGGETPPGLSSLAKLRARYGQPFRTMTRLPGKRDARLWLESMLLALRPLGFTGVLLIVDEHDDGRRAVLNRSIAQLRRQLDRLAEGHLPGTFVLYLVLDDFQSRVQQEHVAVYQRITPLIRDELHTRLMTELRQLRDLDGAAFLKAIAGRIHQIARNEPLPGPLAQRVEALAQQHQKLAGVDTRGFVKSFVQLIET